jgi:hypothetical protein
MENNSNNSNNSNITTEALINAISKLSDKDKKSVSNMLKLSTNDTEQTFDSVVDNDNKSLDKLMNNKKKIMHYGVRDNEEYATSGQVMALRSKIDALQLDMIDMVRHLKDYTRQYMDVAKKPMVEGLTDYVDQLTEQGNLMNRIEKAKENSIEESVKEEEKSGIVGNIFNTVKSTVKGAVSGANTILNVAAENGSNAINAILPNTNEEEPQNNEEEPQNEEEEPQNNEEEPQNNEEEPQNNEEEPQNNEEEPQNEEEEPQNNEENNKPLDDLANIVENMNKPENNKSNKKTTLKKKRPIRNLRIKSNEVNDENLNKV